MLFFEVERFSDFQKEIGTWISINTGEETI